MKTKKAALRAVVLMVAVLALTTCTNPISDLLNADNWGLVGTWVSTYTGGFTPGSFYKLIVRSDGTFRSEDSGGGMFYEETYTVDNVSVSGNSRTFRIHYVYAGGTADAYVLARITDGTSYESVFDSMQYPASISTSNMSYLRAALQ